MVYPSESIILKAFSIKFSAAAVAVVKRVFGSVNEWKWLYCQLLAKFYGRRTDGRGRVRLGGLQIICETFNKVAGLQLAT